MKVKKEQLDLDMEQRTGSKLERYASMLYIVNCLFNLYAEYIIWNARLYEVQTGMKTVTGNISNFKYEDGSTLMAESEEVSRLSWLIQKRKMKKLGKNSTIKNNEDHAFRS